MIFLAKIAAIRTQILSNHRHTSLPKKTAEDKILVHQEVFGSFRETIVIPAAEMETVKQVPVLRSTLSQTENTFSI